MKSLSIILCFSLVLFFFSNALASQIEDSNSSAANSSKSSSSVMIIESDSSEDLSKNSPQVVETSENSSKGSPHVVIIDADSESLSGTSVMGAVYEDPVSSWRKRASALASRGGLVARTAKKFIGVPYRWGGVSPAGFDCSGFILKVYGANGINVKRMADEQYYGGKKIKKSELLVGDLVFFSTYAPGVSHVGIYLGKGKFIHASSSRGVTIDSLDSDYYKNAYVGACRYW